MNSDFPRIITLLRKERGISQKQAAADLGVSQALLSHYEKGIRECGLEFLVKTADYYNVSCDYLLGRCAEPGGNAAQSAAPDINEGQASETGIRKLLLDSQRLIFAMVSKHGSEELDREVTGFLGLAVYRIFRVLYSANPRNDRRFFTVESAASDGYAQSAMEIRRSRAEDAAAESLQNVSITTNTISEEYPEYASSLLNAVKQCEEDVEAAQKMF